MPPDLFPLALDGAQGNAACAALGTRAVLPRGLARECGPALVAAIDGIAAASPFRHMVTPGGWEVSFVLTNCGQVGSVTDRTGYRYVPGAHLSLHQDRNERDFDQPIVSVSLGPPAIFLWGGKTRTDKVRRVPRTHGDVVVWGGPDRLTFRGAHSLA
jgi:DNA oxidative demethylase